MANHELVTIKVNNCSFDQNFLENYKNETNSNIKAGHFYLKKYFQLILPNCTFNSYNQTIIDRLKYNHGDTGY